MPKYRNGTERPIVFGGVSYKPGETKSVNIFLPYTELGLTKVSDDPAVPSPVLVCEEVEIVAGETETIEIPWGADRISVSAVSVAGQAILKLGDDDIGIPLDDYSGGYASPPGGHRWSRVARISLESEAGATVSVLVEGVA